MRGYNSKFYFVPVFVVIIKPDVNDSLIDALTVFRMEHFAIRANAVANLSR